MKVKKIIVPFFGGLFALANLNFNAGHKTQAL
ncbi:MAG: hypothetical protein Ct9H300mP6_15740 [Gammaproteobacteria bacterium]|nr:MAG: hypothetical protein Ct9H300mP6_15740 [Gammaproteobacteria bacterium]